MENFLKLVISLHFDLNYICDLVREALGHTKTILSLFIIFVIAEHEHKNYTISIYYCYVIIIIIEGNARICSLQIQASDMEQY